MLASWLLRIASRYGSSFRVFSRTFLDGKVRVVVGFDAFPNILLLQTIGAVQPETESRIIRDHSLVGTYQCLRTGPYSCADIPAARQPGRRVYNRTGTVPQKHWHICPTCRALELERGVLTWQRNAQIPGVRYCGIHGVPLAMITNTCIRASLPPSETDLHGMVINPITDPRREQQHIQLARDLADALDLDLPHLGTDGVDAAITCVLRDANIMKAGAERIPWGKIVRQISAAFGETIFTETELDGALVKIQRREFLHEPGPDRLVFLALFARSFGVSLSHLLHGQRMPPSAETAALYLPAVATR